MNQELLDGFSIGPFQISPREEKIVGPDATHHVEPKVMQVLVTLASQPGHTVSRNDILETVWSDTVVGDEVLSRAISLLRGYFQDERTNPKYIRTIPRQGYELIASVEHGTAVSRSGRRTSLPVMLGAALVLVIAVVAAVRFWPSSPAADLTLAVMPLSVSGEQVKLAYMADGLADHLITQLTRSPSLNIVARRSSFLIRDDDANVRAIGEQLGARYIIEGSLADREGNLLLTLYVVDTELGTNLWTTQILGPANDITELQFEAERALSAALRDKLDVKISTSRKLPLRTIPEAAYLKYHEARYQWSLRGELRIARAIDLLQEAIALAPDFAAAHMALAETVAVQPFYSDAPVAERFTLARASATKALELDRLLAADVAALEGFLLFRERRWQDAEASLQDALRLDDKHVYGHYWYSWVLSALGKYEEALAHIKTAWELNPVSAVINDRLAVSYMWADDLEGAAARYQAAADLGYLESTQELSLILFLFRTAQFDQIEALLTRAGHPDAWVKPLVQGFRDPAVRAQGIEAVEAARRQGTIPFEYLFGIWVFYEDADRAFRDFDSGPETPYIEFLWTQETEFLRQDSRFAALLESVNLSDHLDTPRSAK
jgi:DNA-binding winged helix-turn-helix (wHTH) protein/TolB-like protein